jgi:hypothetical protein
MADKFNICEICGTDHPALLSVGRAGKYFCSAECADEFTAARCEFCRQWKPDTRVRDGGKLRCDACEQHLDAINAEYDALEDHRVSKGDACPPEYHTIMTLCDICIRGELTAAGAEFVNAERRQKHDATIRSAMPGWKLAAEIKRDIELVNIHYWNAALHYVFFVSSLSDLNSERRRLKADGHEFKTWGLLLNSGYGIRVSIPGQKYELGKVIFS